MVLAIIRQIWTNELCCIKHCWGVYEQDSLVNSVGVDDWTAEWAMIASNVKVCRENLVSP